MIAATPEPPYLAVIFSNQRTNEDQGYGAMAERMVELAREQPGFLGVESARDSEGFGITVSYWKDEAAVEAWKAQPMRASMAVIAFWSRRRSSSMHSQSAHTSACGCGTM